MGKTFRVAVLFAVYSGIGFGSDYAMGLLAQEDAVGKIEVDVRPVADFIDVSDIEGAVLIRDGSGGIEVEEVTEDVLIESDGSGSIEVEDIGGDFVVDQDGSGDIRCSDVSGQVELPDDRRIPDEQRRRRRRRRPCR